MEVWDVRGRKEVILRVFRGFFMLDIGVERSGELGTMFGFLKCIWYREIMRFLCWRKKRLDDAG